MVTASECTAHKSTFCFTIQPEAEATPSLCCMLIYDNFMLVSFNKFASELILYEPPIKITCYPLPKGSTGKESRCRKTLSSPRQSATQLHLVPPASGDRPTHTQTFRQHGRGGLQALHLWSGREPAQRRAAGTGALINCHIH